MRIVTVFTNDFGRFAHYAAADGSGIAMVPPFTAETMTLAEWFRWMAEQRARHRLGGFAYRIQQFIDTAAEEAAAA